MKPDSSPPPNLQLSHHLPSRRRKSLALFGAIAVLLGTGLGWQTWQTRHQVAIGQQQPPGTPVKLETLTTKRMTVSSDFVGSLEAEQTLEIRPEVTGRIKRLLVKAGDRVSPGQRLAELQPDQERANLEGVIATITAAQANQANFQASVDAAKANEASLKANVDAAQINEVILKADVDAAQANEASLKANVDAAQINEVSLKADIAAARVNEASLFADFNAAHANRYSTQAQLAALEDEFLARLADAELALKDYTRLDLLADAGVVSYQALDEAERERDASNADLRAIRHRMEAAQGDVYEAEQNVTRAEAALTQAKLEIRQAEIQLAQGQTGIEQARAQLAQGQAGVTQATAQLAQGQTGIQQAKAQLAQGQAGVTQATAQLEQAQAGFKQAQAESDRAQAQLRETSIIAPFAGVIGDIPVRVGSVVGNDDTLTTLTQNNLLSLRISVPSDRGAELRRGQFVELVTEDGNIINTGQISFISPNIDPSRQTILAKATFSNSGGALRNGQFVRARLIWRSQPGLSVPATAITRLAGEPFVFVATTPDSDAEVPEGTQLIAEQRLVKLGKLQGDRYQVKSGLEVGEQIVVSGVQRLTNGAVLEVLPDDTSDDSENSDFITP